MPYLDRKPYFARYERAFRTIRVSDPVWRALRRAADGTGRTMLRTADEFLGEALERGGASTEPDPRSPERIQAALTVLTAPEPPASFDV